MQLWRNIRKLALQPNLPEIISDLQVNQTAQKWDSIFMDSNVNPLLPRNLLSFRRSI